MSLPVLIGLLIAAVAVLYVIAPLLWPRSFGVGERGAPVAAPDEGSTLLALRDQLLASIVDLDFERAVGKTDEEEYQQERGALKRRALAVIRTLDERNADTAALGETVEQEIRRARARRVADAAPAATESESPDLYDEVERQIRALRSARGAKTARAE